MRDKGQLIRWDIYWRCMSAADEQDRAQVETSAEAVQEITGEHVELAYVDQGYTGDNVATAAAKHGIRPRL